MSRCDIDLFQETTFAKASVARAAKNDAAIRFSGCGKAKKTGPENLMSVSYANVILFIWKPLRSQV